MLFVVIIQGIYVYWNMNFVLYDISPLKSDFCLEVTISPDGSILKGKEGMWDEEL